LQNYGTNLIYGDTFVISVIDRCDEQALITAQPLLDQDYTITDTAKLYQVPAYVVDPIWCAITYTYSVTDFAGDRALTFDNAQETREFTISNTNDLNLSGPTSKDYTVTVTAQVGNVVLRTDSSSFTLTLMNPCIDDNFVNVEKAALPIGETYTLHAFETAGGYTFTHNAFSVVTQPFQHSLCGLLTYTATFNGQAIDAITKPPMAYDTVTNTFDIYSEDRTLIGYQVITVAAYLSEYTLVKSSLPDVTTTIEILDPCLDPFTLDATS